MIIIANYSLAPSSITGRQVTCHRSTEVLLWQNVPATPVTLESFLQSLARGDSCRWILRPVTLMSAPPLRGPAPVLTGNYRIRSHDNSQCLLTMPTSGDIRGYVTGQLPGNEIQQQTVASYSTYYPHLWTDLE
jgi:hypothetical protein